MKISILGAGNAGVFTALYNSLANRKSKNEIDIELIHDPNTPAEEVGQATLLDPPALLWQSMGFNWYNNPIHAIFKSGILYEGFGKVNDKVFHDFMPSTMAMHYCPHEMQSYILNSGLFEVTEKSINNYDDVDGDLVFDCRGKPDDLSEYDELINPTNACILAKPNWDLSTQHWSRHVATPDGWTFVVPSDKDSPSHSGSVGYCYNSDITSKEDAEKNMLEMFDVEITKHVNYKNYVAKNPIIDDRVILNGNRLFFLEPMESSATQTYIEVVRYIDRYGLEDFSNVVKEYIKHTQNFILWHYRYGSKYDTPFWDHAKSLSRFEDYDFDDLVTGAKRTKYSDIISNMQKNPNPSYGQWTEYAFKVWYEGMTRELVDGKSRR